MKLQMLTISLLLLQLLLMQTKTSTQTADIVITNGKVFTSDTNKLYVQAIAIKGNKKIASGTNE